MDYNLHDPLYPPSEALNEYDSKGEKKKKTSLKKKLFLQEAVFPNDQIYFILLIF